MTMFRPTHDSEVDETTTEESQESSNEDDSDCDKNQGIFVEGPKLNDIVIEKCSNITIGNQTHISGPVIIQNYFASSLSLPGTNKPKKVEYNNDKVVISKIRESDRFDHSEPSDFKFMTRHDWLAQPPKESLTLLEQPSIRVIISHTATEGAETQAECACRVKQIQTFHIQSFHWDDIGYNFLIGCDGAVYEGRGWLHQGAHTYRYNRKSIGISFIGTFTKVPPPPQALSALQNIIKEGINKKYLISDYKLYGHRQFSNTESPGEALFNIIKQWEHWSEVDD